jgi:O-antigen/teichoic acid export membrane protein
MGASPGQNLRARVFRGLAWKAASLFFRQFSRIVVAVVLARLLIPEDYGVAAMVLAFSSLVFIFSDLALGAALVQRRELSEEDRSTVFWTSVAFGTLFTLLGLGLAGPLAAFFGEPEVRPLFAVFSLSFLVTALGTTQTALLNREMDFKRLELRMMTATLAGAGIGIALAVAGFGAWALIGQQLAVATVSTALLWAVSPWRPRLVFSLASLRSMGRFGGNVFGTRVLFYVNRYADNVLIGRVLGSSALGFYALAYNVMLAPLSRIAAPVQEVLFPAFSLMQNERRRIATMWIRVNRLVGAVTIPTMLGLVAVAPDFVTVVLGEKWQEATVVIQILAWVGLLQSLQRLNSSILQALDRTGTLLRYSIVVVVASVTAFVAGLHWGIVGVAAGYAISSTLVEPMYAWLTARALGVPVWGFARSLAGVVQAAVVMLGAVLALRLFLVDQGVSAGPRLALVVAAGIAVFVPLCLWRQPEVLAELRRVRGGRDGAPGLAGAVPAEP